LSRSLFFCLIAAANAQTLYQWDLPSGFPKPRVPIDNPMTAAKVALGHHLFYDQRMSADGTQSCASCHIQSLAFTEAKPRGEGSTGNSIPAAA
jgi:cytochrome c peroxidase